MKIGKFHPSVAYKSVAYEKSVRLVMYVRQYQYININGHRLKYRLKFNPKIQYTLDLKDGIFRIFWQSGQWLEDMSGFNLPTEVVCECGVERCNVVYLYGTYNVV